MKDTASFLFSFLKCFVFKCSRKEKPRDNKKINRCIEGKRERKEKKKKEKGQES